MHIRCTNLFDMKFNKILYHSMIDDTDRMIITRWRLSSHHLYIETGRHKRPKIERNERKCIICNTLEDENHAIFECSAHRIIRMNYVQIITTLPTVRMFLNPETIDLMKDVAKFLGKIEENMEKLDMLQ